ncbi:hypothetical protein [Pseudomonas viridiflava]|uniref:hypothetical protein n=1 Tax=Pseudomonas viridiflava TaxID=33069 RepID=UPI001F152FE6|nr:hypothetical protein [Pseudomonas viridiflava]
MKINITPTTAIRLTINETVVANKGCPKATPNLALVPPATELQNRRPDLEQKQSLRSSDRFLFFSVLPSRTRTDQFSVLMGGISEAY